MPHTPRNLRLALALFIFVCGARQTHAQARAAAPPTQGQSAAQAGREAKPAREAKAPEAGARGARARAERTRRKAVGVLLEVADGAKAVEDLFQRASVLALCADALWEADEQAARAVFGRAWEAAAESDEEDLKDEREHGRYGDLPERFTRARDLVLAAAARRDARTADAWLGALADWLSGHESRARDEAASGGGAGTDVRPPGEFTRDGQRLALASALVEEEAYDAAARVAAPALEGGASGALVEFLLSLRGRAPDEADRLYLQLLAGVRAGAGSRANDVLLLSSYALTPRLLAAVGADGSLQFRTLGGPPDGATPRRAEAPDPRVRAAFFETASAVLLRPTRPAGDAADSAALYFAVGRLLPFFEREAPRHAPALHARLAELASAVDAARRAALDSQMQTQSLSRSNPADPLGGLLETVGRAADVKLRDDARLHAVRAAAAKRLWERARGLAGEIEDAEKRRDARSVIDAYQVASVGEGFLEKEEDDFERAAALVRAAEVTPALRAYGLARAAELAAKRRKRVRAEALLEEALAYASQPPAGTSLRDAASMAAATVAARIGSPRATEALAASVAALNEDELFDGERIWFNLDDRLNLSPGEAGALNEAFRPFDVGVMFGEAARGDFDRAAAEARNLKSVSARSRALVAAARAALEKNARAGAASVPAR
ncbi:MAG TPA: hypothetical protein VF611_01140 [Pyrinomonadaceae bacterium]|jgi:hypothetical protein